MGFDVGIWLFCHHLGQFGLGGMVREPTHLNNPQRLLLQADAAITQRLQHMRLFDLFDTGEISQRASDP